MRKSKEMNNIKFRRVALRDRKRESSWVELPRILMWMFHFLKLDVKYVWLCLIFILFKNMYVELPWWASGKECALKCRGHRFDPWSRKVPYAMGQLSPCITATESICLECMLCNKRSTSVRAHTPQLESSFYLQQLEKSPCYMKTQCSQKQQTNK